MSCSSNNDRPIYKPGCASDNDQIHDIRPHISNSIVIGYWHPLPSAKPSDPVRFIGRSQVPIHSPHPLTHFHFRQQGFLSGGPSHFQTTRQGHKQIPSPSPRTAAEKRNAVSLNVQLGICEKRLIAWLNCVMKSDKTVRWMLIG